MAPTPRNWLITGCSTGFGRALAEVLIARGERVFATARHPNDLNDVFAGHDNVQVLQLDVTQQEDIHAVVDVVNSEGGVDVLINNAGYGYIAAIEEGDEHAYRQLFETNVFGLIAMTRAVLPGMRARGSGHVVNISSVGGMVGNPGSGYYAATKFAVVGFSEALAKEAKDLGIKVTVVAPGPFRTDWAGRSLKTAEHPIAAYEHSVHARLKSLSQISGHQQGDPTRGAEAILAAVDSPNPPVHLVLGAPGLEMVRQHLTSLGEEIDAWEAVTLGADFPHNA
ncbi:SDR family NAD(P)-dependent oxidoreductase [Pseudomonas sp. C2L12B]|uniref:SDR family NAD(P)-dependent oxidoreductase n=2 Tax=Pseudomonas typographi TaxID=2715964 RepID=A0ABR7Z2R6_9PSED|nr:oxidoreductase [Pseudomonas typographi]MBD1550299.1 SDR family NAD(P)-dependent oxidoreductase [Pseudomonas typographi]MBD1585935.1 SDR family NAD(P)-dependent oxidoreductase [Pseudomonas typographi]MBD1599699.1 SDR family NAD(P)-dependent oxidoreductase [Pseudomonas typographi]